MKKIAVFFCLAMLLAACTLTAAAYDDGVISFEVPSGYEEISDLSSQYMKCWGREADACLFYLAVTKNVNKQPTAGLTEEEKEKLLESSGLGIDMNLSLVSEDMHTSTLEAEEITVNGYDGLKMTTTLSYNNNGVTESAPLEMYVFASEDHMILFEFMNLGPASGLQNAKRALDTLTIYEPIIYGSAKADDKEEKGGLSSEMKILLCGLGGGAVGGLIGLVVALLRRKKKKAAQTAPTPQYAMPASPQMPQQYGPQTQYGVPGSMPQTQYGVPGNVPQTQYGVPGSVPQTQYGVPGSVPQTQHGVPEQTVVAYPPVNNENGQGRS